MFRYLNIYLLIKYILNNKAFDKMSVVFMSSKISIVPTRKLKDIIVCGFVATIL